MQVSKSEDVGGRVSDKQVAKARVCCQRDTVAVLQVKGKERRAAQRTGETVLLRRERPRLGQLPACSGAHQLPYSD